MGIRIDKGRESLCNAVADNIREWGAYGTEKEKLWIAKLVEELAISIKLFHYPKLNIRRFLELAVTWLPEDVREDMREYIIEYMRGERW